MRISIRSGILALLPIFGLPRRLAYIAIDGDTVNVRMSWAFRAKFAKADVMEVVTSGRS